MISPWWTGRREIVAHGYNALPVFCYILRDEAAKAATANVFARYFVNDGGPTVDCVISLLSYAVAELLHEERMTTACGQLASCRFNRFIFDTAAGDEWLNDDDWKRSKT